MNASSSPKRENNPREHSSIFSILTFAFTFPLFKKSLKKDLEDYDVYENLSKLSSKKLGEELERSLEKQQKSSGKRSLARALFRCYAKRYLLLGLMNLAVKIFMILALPRAMGKMIAYFQPGQSTISRTELYLYALLMVFIYLANAFYLHNYYQLVIEEGIKMRTALTALIYRKALRVSAHHSPDVTVGKVVTLITKDVFVFEQAVMYVNDMWIELIRVMVVCYMVYIRVGISVTAGLGFLLVMIVLLGYFGKKASSLRRKSAKATDARIQFTTEALSAIKTVKMYSLENFFENKISDIRNVELKYLAAIYYLKSIALTISRSAIRISFLLILMVNIWLGNLVDTETIYYIENSFSQVKNFVLSILPYSIAQCAEVYATMTRITQFLNRKEVSSEPVTATKPGVFLSNVSVVIAGIEILSEITLSAEKGLHLITGNVGSGKTALLKTILGEYPIRTGRVEICGTISYAAEDPWVFPSTIKQNILFGREYNEKRYNEVLSVCALKLDLSKFPEGDETTVGDRGVSLSKGQQVRISLARAIYKESDIYIIDDCLNHLDSSVNIYIFRKCIMELLKFKTVIMVTNNTNHIELVPNRNIFVIGNGRTERDTISNNDGIDASVDEITEHVNDFQRNEEYTGDIVSEKCDETTQLLSTETIKRNIYHEEKRAGKVTFSVYSRYSKFAGGIFMMITLLLILAVTQVISSYCEKLLSLWVNMEPKVGEFIKSNMTHTLEYIDVSYQRTGYMKLHTILLLISMILSFLRAFLTFFFALRASKKLHRSMTNSVLHSFMTFFDGHYVGNIINRFSKDISTVDETLPLVIFEVLKDTILAMSIIVVISSVNTMFLIPAAVLLVALALFQRLYLRAGRSIKRLDSSTRSPMIGHLNATLEGLTTVRAFGNQSILTKEFDEHLDHFTSANYSMYSLLRFLDCYISVMSAVFMMVVIMKFVFFDTGTKAGDVGLALSQAGLLSHLLQWTLGKYAELENNMTATERVIEYTDIPTEELKSGQIKENWPSEGRIEYRDISLTYNLTKQQALKSMSFVVQPKEKIGVVGRTGAGKSSIVSSLFRLYRTEGTIFVDGVDIRTLPLEFLRKNINIIPQDPILFSGTIRSNIDPTEEYSDELIWKALDAVGMASLISNLNVRITENGSTYSFGQRQLICLARALVKESKIIVLDEATASVDSETCMSIQAMMKREFRDCTVLTIAHRLSTVLDSDKIMVVDDGRAIEFDSPNVLLQNENSVFHRMVKEAGLLKR